LRESQTVGRASSFDDETIILLHTPQIASVAADFLCGDTCLACIRQLVCMFAVKNDARARGLQNEGDELRQLAVAEDRGDGKFSNIQLIEDLARGGERLNEYGFRVTHVFRYDVEIFQRQGEIFRKRAVVRNDAQHRAPGTMRLQAAPAERAQRLVAIGGAGHIDFACHALAHPALSCFGGDARNLHDFADKFMPRRAAKLVIAAQDFHVGIADSREPHADESPTRAQPRQRLLHREETIFGDLKREYGQSMAMINAKRQLEIAAAPAPAPERPCAGLATVDRLRCALSREFQRVAAASALRVAPPNDERWRCRAPWSAAIAWDWSRNPPAVYYPRFRLR